MTTQPADASDLIGRLVRNGLGQGEARCYVGMLAPRAFRVSEISQRASLPRSRVYELIRSLVRSGLCTEVVSSRAARFRAVPPNEAIARLEALAGEQARRRSAALRGALSALEGRAARRGDHQDTVEPLRRHEQVLDRCDQEVRAAERELLAVAATPSQALESPALHARLRAGVGVRAVHERAACAAGPERDRLARHAGQGVQVRLVDRVPSHFTVFDRRTVLLDLWAHPGHQPGTRSGSLLIRHGGLAELLQQAFERLWERGQPLGGPSSPAAAVHSDQHVPIDAQEAGDAVPGDDRRPGRFPRPG
jgi:HTH-type transcriptional regulator, sugar sensing transcriptional regulator